MKKSLIAMAALCAAAMASIGAAVVNVLRPLGKAIEGHMLSNGLILQAITSGTKMAQGQQQRLVYHHLDDAATPALITLYPGFKPVHVVVENLTDRIRYEWKLGMNEGDYLKTVAAGTRTLETDDVLIVEDDEGARPSITVAASIVLQNKLYSVLAE